MPVLDDILREQSRAQDDQLLDARKTANWTQTFNGPQSTEALRASRNYADMIDQTIGRKMELAAQTDQKAQGIWHKQAEFNEWQRQAPLRDQLLQRQVESQGAETRFKELKEIQTHEQTARFFEGIASPDAPKPSTPQYAPYVHNLLRKNPAFATTTTARDVLKSLVEEDEAATRLNEIVPGISEDMEVTSTTEYIKGRGQVTKRSKSQTAKDSLDAEAKSAFGVPLSQLRAPLKSESGRIVKSKEGLETFEPSYGGDTFKIQIRKDGEPKDITMSRAEYERFGLPLGEKDKQQAEVASPAEQPAQFDSEDVARKSGHKTGDIVMMRNPKTGKYQRARLD